MTLALTGFEGAVGAAIAGVLEADARPLQRIAAAALTTRSSAAEALQSTVNAGGTIDAVVHAHVPPEVLRSGTLASLSDEEWDARCEAPVRATINLMQAAYAHLRENGGVIVVVQPTVGLTGQNQFAAYAAACEAQRCLVKSVSRAWGRHNIRAHSVVVAPELFGGELGQKAPGMTTLSPLSLRGRSNDDHLATLMGTLRFLLSDAAAGLTGTTTAVDSGRWMPL